MSVITHPNFLHHEMGSTKTHYNDILDVTAMLASEKPHTVAKAIYTAIDCANAANAIPEEYQKSAASIRYHTSLIKLTNAPGVLLNGFNNVRRKTVDVLSGEGSKFDLARAANNLIGPIHDIADFFTKAILYIPKKSIETLQGVNGGSIIFNFGYESYKDLEVIHDSTITEVTGKKRDKEFTKVAGALLKLINDVSLFALGWFTVFTVFFSVAISSTVFTVASAISVVATIIGYYHKNLGTEIKIK